jgi:hypothetical protein
MELILELGRRRLELEQAVGDCYLKKKWWIVELIEFGYE